jgi:hypothetical protein
MRRAVLLFCFLLAGALSSAVTGACLAAAHHPAVPSPSGLLLLIRTTMIAIDQANKTGDYAVLRALGGPGLHAYSDAQLAGTFAPFRESRADLAEAAIATPELSERPIVATDGRLTLVGYFPTHPLRIGFRFVYEAVHGAWQPFGVSVSLVPAPPGTASTKQR